MADDYIELFLKWTPGADTHVVREWLKQHGLSVVKMKSGVLLSATRGQIEKAFSVSLENVQPPVELPAPVELGDHVASVTFPKPRSYHA